MNYFELYYSSQEVINFSLHMTRRIDQLLLYLMHFIIDITAQCIMQQEINIYTTTK